MILQFLFYGFLFYYTCALIGATIISIFTTDPVEKENYIDEDILAGYILLDIFSALMFVFILVPFVTIPKIIIKSFIAKYTEVNNV